jgi:NAD(P)H-hydrate epimerase
MDRRAIDRVIAVFGTQRDLAGALGVDQSSVSGWRRRGTIPARRQARILEIAAARGLDLGPADFFSGAGRDSRDGRDGRDSLGPGAAPRHPDMGPASADGLALLSVEEMARADGLAMAAGVTGERLMETAGAAVAREIVARWEKCAVAVLCGPGNNGGDGFVVARLLAVAGWKVRLALLGPLGRLKGDAALNAGRWRRPIARLDPSVLDGAGLVVDALFGAGLSRPLGGKAGETVEAVGARGIPCVSIDVPSGVHGDSGEILAGAAPGVAPDAALTVTFFRKKPGHLLLPGRLKAGELVVADIGIPESVLAEIAPRRHENGPALWRGAYPWPRPADHKYSRGHVVVAGGAGMTGAARLAARGAARAGAGLVSIASPPEAADIYRREAGILTVVVPRATDFRALVHERRKSALLVGPGNGVDDRTRAHVLAALGSGKPCVVDADAIGVFAGAAGDLASAIRGPTVLTPHDGEFARLFEGSEPEGGNDRLSRACAGAAALGAVLLLKGADTVIAAPDGRATINANAPPDLATGGSGDVLAGFIVALLGQGMDPFDAARAGAWLHGAAAAEFGAGLIAEDLPDALPVVLRRLRGDRAAG